MNTLTRRAAVLALAGGVAGAITAPAVAATPSPQRRREVALENISSLPIESQEAAAIALELGAAIAVYEGGERPAEVRAWIKVARGMGAMVRISERDLPGGAILFQCGEHPIICYSRRSPDDICRALSYSVALMVAIREGHTGAKAEEIAEQVMSTLQRWP